MISMKLTCPQSIFGPSDDFQVAPGQTPVEDMEGVLDDTLIAGELTDCLTGCCNSPCLTVM